MPPSTMRCCAEVCHCYKTCICNQRCGWCEHCIVLRHEDEVNHPHVEYA